MELSDFVLVFVEDHPVEPPEPFDAQKPATCRNDAGKLKQRDDGTEAWVFDGEEATDVGLNLRRERTEGLSGWARLSWTTHGRSSRGLILPGRHPPGLGRARSTYDDSKEMTESRPYRLDRRPNVAGLDAAE